MTKLPKKTSLAACLALACTLPLPAHAGTITLTVTSCLDHGAGTLRDTITQAGTLSDDVVIDLTHLSCSIISLSTGELVSTKSFLSLQGPGSGRLEIAGNVNGRVIDHKAAGGLFIYDLSIGGGHQQSAQANGGCIYSSSNVTLVRSNVSYCVAIGTDGAKGGAIYAKTAVGLNGQNTVSHNLVYASGASATAEGGGIYAPQLLLIGSTIASNTALTPFNGAFGGGIKGSSVFSFGNTISDNSATEGGGIFIELNGTGTIAESTVSGNTVTGCGGGIYSKYKLFVQNSTIAFNRAESAAGTRACYGGGIYSAANATTVSLTSTIVSNNLGGQSGADFASDFSASIGTGSANGTITGNNNLIPVTDAGSRAPPGGTLHSDPLLQPLAKNGGFTLTHALAKNSPAIDHGTSTPTDTNDQRGTGFARVIGTSADIGAFEFDPNLIFRNGFE